LNIETTLYLRVFCQNQPHDWEKYFTAAKFCHNQRPYSFTNTSPFYLLMGYKP
ncbi:hypothetical protein SERLADRAFT_340836, partial [Serpula lacrymans var. lacrymans S7.9]